MRGRRYFDKMEHKRRMKKKHARQYGNRENPKLLEQEMRQDLDDSAYSRRRAERNGGYHYWDQFYLSGSRGFAKKYSDKRIRQKFREQIRNEDPEDVSALRGSEYEKEFDYAWAVW